MWMFSVSYHVNLWITLTIQYDTYKSSILIIKIYYTSINFNKKILQEFQFHGRFIMLCYYWLYNNVW